MLIKLNWGQQPSQQHIFDFSAILCESKKYRRSVATSAPQKHLHRATSTEMILPIVSYYASFVFPCTGQHIIMCPTTMCLYYYYAFDSSMPLFFWTNAFAYCLYMSKKIIIKKIHILKKGPEHGQAQLTLLVRQHCCSETVRSLQSLHCWLNKAGKKKRNQWKSNFCTEYTDTAMQQNIQEHASCYSNSLHKMNEQDAHNLLRQVNKHTYL